VIELPGRAWAFLAEFGTQLPVDAEALITRLWHPVPENVVMLRSARFGELLRAAALDTARAYLPHPAQATTATTVPSTRGVGTAVDWFRKKR
jgi:hypothetical protein